MNHKFFVILFFCPMLINGQNLILNPDCELPLVAGEIPYWTETVDNSWGQRSADPPPQSGKSYFFAGAGVEAELMQLINVTEYSCSIDNQKQTFQFNGFVRSYLQNPPDQTQIIIELLDSQNRIVFTYNSGINSTTSSWDQVSQLITAPVGTRAIRIRLQSHRKNGSNNDGYFDNLSLVPIPSEKNIVISSLTSTSTTCGAANGSVTVQATGGTGQLMYSLDGTAFQGTGTYLNVMEGVYTVTVKDQASPSCTTTRSVTVTGGNQIRIQNIGSTSATCGQSNGSLLVRATGVMQVLYSIDGTNYQSTGIFNNLKAGTYRILIKDQAGCSDSQTATVVTGEKPKITQITVEPATCGQDNAKMTVLLSGNQPFRYELNGRVVSSLSDVVNLAAGVYKINIKDRYDCGVDTSVVITKHLSPTISNVIARDASCGNRTGEISIEASSSKESLVYSLDGITFQQESVFKGLTGGSYTVFVRDQNKCITTATVKLNATLAPTIQMIETVATRCGENNGQLTVVATGANSFLRYSLDSLIFQSTPVFNNLKPSSYAIFVRDDKGCMSKSKAQILTSSAPRIDLIQSQPAHCEKNDGTLTIQASGGGPLTYAITGRSFQNQRLFDNLSSGSYEIMVQDSQGCIVKQTALIDEDCQQPNCYLPTAFTPNGDGINDLLGVIGNSLDSVTLTIYNRWGEVLFKSDQKYKQWDGTYLGRICSTGEYSWQIESSTAIIHQFKRRTGKVLLIR